MEYLSMAKSQELIKTINSLISSSNTWGTIESFLINSEDIKKYLDDAKNEMTNAGNNSYSSMVIMALKNMVEHIKDLEHIIINLEDDTRDSLMKENAELKKHNLRLQIIVDSIKNLTNDNIIEGSKQ